MELKHLHTFFALSEIRNFTKTAEYLHYAQSNVTTQIQQLEEELGVKLFERLGRNVALTAEGMELIPYARQMLNLSQEVKLKFSQQNRGRITIGASESIGIYRLPEIIKRFQRQYPNVDLYLRMLDAEEVVPMLVNNIIDMAFILDLPIDYANTTTVWQMDETIGLFAAPGHPLAKQSAVEVTALADVSLILTEKECCYRKLFDKDLMESTVTPRIVLETSSLQVIKETTLSGLGICLLPQLAVEKELAHQELIPINYKIKGKIVSQLIHHKDKWVSPQMENFIDLAIACC